MENNESKSIDNLIPLRRFHFHKDIKSIRYGLLILFTIGSCILIYFIFYFLRLGIEPASIVISIAFGTLIVTCISVWIRINKMDYTVTFYENYIKLNENIESVKNIRFVGLVVYEAGKSGKRRFEVRTDSRKYEIITSSKCREYFKEYCKEKGIETNIQ